MVTRGFAFSSLLCNARQASSNVAQRSTTLHLERSRWTRQYADKAARTHGGVKSTLPSSTSPSEVRNDKKRKPDVDDGDRGYLAFTKSSLFKLTLPLQPPSSDAQSIESKASSAFAKHAKSKNKFTEEEEQTRKEAEESAVETGESWEMLADQGERISQIDPMNDNRAKSLTLKRKRDNEDILSDDDEPVDRRKESRSRLKLHGSEMGEPSDEPANEFDAKAPAHSVVFLLHSAQPLSYVASLIEAEGPGFGRDAKVEPVDITFHSRITDSKRWSPATSIGDFLRDAARIGSFAIRLKPPSSASASKEGTKQTALPHETQVRNIAVSVPSFEDRTRFLRAALYSKTAEVERMAKLKAECDHIARQTARRLAISGAFILGGWWITIFSITFLSTWGWDLAEPLTYLTGLAAVMGGYSWFLIHNREVSYRAVLTETTSRRQQRLYVEKGLNIERYEDTIDECKELRKQIKKVAEDYDLEWDQSKSSSGHNKRALEIVQRREASEQQPIIIKQDSDNDASDETAEERQDDNQRKQEEEEKK